jgi:hypothetical protein
LRTVTGSVTIDSRLPAFFWLDLVSGIAVAAALPAALVRIL